MFSNFSLLTFLLYILHENYFFPKLINYAERFEKVI